MTSFTSKLASAKGFSGVSRPKLVSGTYLAKVVGAEYGKNQAGTGFRGMYKLEVAEGELTSALTNTYLTESTKDEQQTASNLKPYFDILVANGVAAERIEGDAETWQDIINNIISLTNRLLRNGTEVMVKLVVKDNPKDEARPWKNVFPVDAETNPLEQREATPEERASFAAS